MFFRQDCQALFLSTPKISNHLGIGSKINCEIILARGKALEKKAYEIFFDFFQQSVRDFFSALPLELLLENFTILEHNIPEFYSKFKQPAKQSSGRIQKVCLHMLLVIVC